MRKILFPLLFSLLALSLQAQPKNAIQKIDEAASTGRVADTLALQRLAAHVAVFAQNLPQEKVYVHMDNTCYFMGDTIWFAAYTQQTNLSIPSTVSRVLYAELFNQDGYLVERQLIKMENGKGCGQFVLEGNLYSGYYELRAYTRWQLNWGQTEHEHTDYAEDWFFNKQMAKDYYRDYDKLYSRVFPVYDKPDEDGFFVRDMTLRPLRRYFRDALEPPALVLRLYPEGGQVVAGVDCNVAFEATNKQGEWKEGRVELRDATGQVVATAETEHRGRGTLHFVPQAGVTYEATFSSAYLDTITDPSRKERRMLTVKEKLAETATDGVALAAERGDGGWTFHVAPVGTVARKALGLTVMHQGVLETYRKVQDSAVEVGTVHDIYIPDSILKAGVNQVTVFDAEGQAMADRLFFVIQPSLYRPTLSVAGLKERYQAYEPIEFDLRAENAMDGEQTVSLAVRDAVTQDYTYDSGNIMTEMLLASEIKGYVPQPDWYFAADDEEHRRGLELLMLTQGWRRFSWTELAVPQAFELTHPAEYTQVINGEVYRYTAFRKEDPEDVAIFIEQLQEMGYKSSEIREELAREFGITASSNYANPGGGGGGDDEEATWDDNDPDIVTAPMLSSVASSRYAKSENNLKKDVLVHAEFFRPGDEGLEGEIETDKGTFAITAPDFEGNCYFMLSASDTTKWKKTDKPAKNIYRRMSQTHQWVSTDGNAYAEFYVRLNFPYPRFVKPYEYYHKQMAEQLSDRYKDDLPGVTIDRLHRTLNAVTVRATHGGLRRFDATKPAFILDAYEAFNATVDAGFSPAFFSGASSFMPNVARTYIGDMNQYRSYGLESRFEGWTLGESNRFATPGSRRPYHDLKNLDSVYVYTDYAPREEGSERYEQSNQPTVTIDLRRLPDEGIRATYRDRRLILAGFSTIEEFYHPDYSRALPPEEQRDYRRTLYWNPALPLRADGTTHVKLYNNGKLTSVNVKAAGMTSSGQMLYNE